MKPHVWSLVIFLALLAAWQLAGSQSPSASFFFSTPLGVMSTCISMVRDGSLILDSLITAGEALGGFIIGNVVGACIGILLWYSDFVARVSRPYLVALGALPVFAIAPMTILWFGIGIGAKVALAFLSTVFLAAAQAFTGVQEVDPLLVQRFKVFGADRRMIFLRLLLPSALVWIVQSLRITFGAALLGAFVGEFIASERGVGHMIVRASGLYDTSRVLVGVFAMISMALISEALIRLTEMKLFRWRR